MKSWIKYYLKRKRNFSLFKFLVVLAVAAVLVILVVNKKPVIKDAPVSKNPEMKIILQSKDQEKRLLAGRKLVERVGVESALEILKNSSLPNTGEGHLVVHQVGFFAYKKYGVDSILHCKDYFLFGCFHGAIIEAASDQGFDVIKKMTDRCRESYPRHFQCAHAAGHAIMAIWNYDLPEALKTCDEQFESKESEEILTSCHNGVFMENLFGVHDFATGKELKRDWLSDDVYYPCNAVAEKYQKGCWLNQAARIYVLFQGDLVRTAQACREIGNTEYSEWCLDNLARQIHAMTNNDVGKAFALCQTLGTDWRDKCVVVNAGSYYSVGGRNQALEICRLVIPELKESCYEIVTGQIVGDSIGFDEKVDLCQKVERPYISSCFQKLGILPS